MIVELSELVSGGGVSGSQLVRWDWSVPKLRSALKFRQGYHPDSPSITYLLTILSELTPKQQRLFMRFITGSPSLPGGQIAALNPPLTVVKVDTKQSDFETAMQLSLEEKGNGGGAVPSSQHYMLPTVMTCNHWFKLPNNYPSMEIMREKLLIAITEGAAGFTLS
jgi:E3 ubiquitin-protein ligase TRIP12